MNKNILVVDDDVNLLAAFSRTLRHRYEIETASSGAEALGKLRRGEPYAVVVVDMQMPGMSGLELLVKVEAAAPDTVRMMLTGNADQRTAVEAVNRGHVFRFLNKPCTTDSLAVALDAGLKQFSLVMAERELLAGTLNGTIRLLTDVLGRLYPEAFGHSERVRNYVREYASFLQLKEPWDLEAAALLGPVGYLTIPPALVEKSRCHASLSPAEEGLLERLPEMGATLLANIPRLESVAAIVRFQQKHYDGSGFPAANVAGEDIPIGARILKVLHDLVSFESQTGDKGRALAAMRDLGGVYDPRVFQSALACFDVDVQGPSSGEAVIRACALRELSIGNILGSNVETQDGVLVAAAGTELTPIVLQRLRNFAEINPLKEPLYVKS